MINVQNLVQTRSFARQDGAILGLVWIVSFAFTMLAVKPDQSFLGLIGNLLLISTPFVVGKRLKSFRDYALEGTISFRRGTFYCMQTFFNATLLLTVVQFLWFSFMDMGPFMALLESTYQPVMQEVYHLSEAEAKATIDTILSMKPLAWASMFMITDLIVGVVLSPVIAAIMAQRVSIKNINNQQ